MAKRSTSENGRDRLDKSLAALNQSMATLNEAMATLTQNQAAFLAHAAKTDRIIAKYRRRTDERFARIENGMATILRVLTEHSLLLERLPETICDKIGFKPPAGSNA